MTTDHAILAGLGIALVILVQLMRVLFRKGGQAELESLSRRSGGDEFLEGAAPAQAVTIEQISDLLATQRKQEAFSSFMMSVFFFLLGLASSIYVNEISSAVRSVVASVSS